MKIYRISQNYFNHLQSELENLIEQSQITIRLIENVLKELYDATINNKNLKNSIVYLKTAIGVIRRNELTDVEFKNKLKLIDSRIVPLYTGQITDKYRRELHQALSDLNFFLEGFMR